MQASNLCIADVVFTRGVGSFYYDDLAAIQAGAIRDGERYLGDPITPGFSSIRMPAALLRIGLRLSDGSFVWGDAMSVQYAGAANRDPVFNPALFDEEVNTVLRDRMVGALAGDLIENLRRARDVVADGPMFHRGFAYGMSQALLAACAYAERRTMTEALYSAFSLRPASSAVPIYAQSGENRHAAVDKMIAKRVDVLPHGLINSMTDFGDNGETFLAYTAWVQRRVLESGDDSYRPDLHFDIYGLGGKAFADAGALTTFLGRLEAQCAPLNVRVESPVIEATREAQVEAMASIRSDLQRSGIQVGLVVDEWCNEIEDVKAFIAGSACDMIQIKMPDVGWLDEMVHAVSLCQAGGVSAFLGGSCTETDLSARFSVHVAIATGADQLLAKPGMGVDEAVTITRNEQAAVLRMLDIGT